MSKERLCVSDQRPYTTLSRRYLWQSRWYNVRQDQLRNRSGGELIYTVTAPAVWVVPVTADGELVLIDQYRYTVDAWCLEFRQAISSQGWTRPAWRRELREEIGGTAQQLIPVAEFYSMNGIGDEVAQVYLALGVTLGEPQHEPTEHIRLRLCRSRKGWRWRTVARSRWHQRARDLLSEPVLRQYLGSAAHEPAHVVILAVALAGCWRLRQNDPRRAAIRRS